MRSSEKSGKKNKDWTVAEIIPSFFVREGDVANALALTFSSSVVLVP
jgi:hypothetical protein